LLDIGILYQGLESRQVGFPQIFGVDGFGVEAVSVPFGSAVHGVVFGAGHGFGIVAVIRPLNAFNDSDPKACGQVRVFAVGFLATSPAWIPENIDVGRPECQVLVLAPFVFHLFVVGGFRSGLVADGREGSENGVFIKGGGHTDGLRKNSGVSAACDTMQGFVPPTKRWYAQSGDWLRIILHEGYFFFQAETIQKVLSTNLVRQGRIGIGWLGH